MFFSSLFTSKKSEADKALSDYISGYFGFRPRDLQLFRQAVLHKSVTKSKKEGIMHSNERMEFLGDAVLDAIIGAYLYRRFPDRDEGFLSKARSRLVSRTHLIHLAVSTGLDRLMVSGLTDPAVIRGLAGNAMEAMIGAVYLQKGFDFTYKRLLKLIERFTDIEDYIKKSDDYKSMLYRWAQARKKELRFEAQSVLDGWFEVTLFVDENPIGKARAKNKRSAEHEVARKAMARLNIKR